MKILPIYYSGTWGNTQFLNEKNNKKSFQSPLESGKSCLIRSPVIFKHAGLGYPSILKILFAKV